MGIYNKYVAPLVRYMTYASFLAMIVMFAIELRKIYQSDCRMMIFDALSKPFVPALIFFILFFWKEINDFVSRSAFVDGEKKSPVAKDDKETPEKEEEVVVVVEEEADSPAM